MAQVRKGQRLTQSDIAEYLEVSLNTPRDVG
jgi:DNA-binding transcriptional regulator YiaG